MSEDREQECIDEEVEHQTIDFLDGDDEFPGTFFRIPGTPVPGKTTWSLA